ncbi:putative RAD57 protein [Rhodotorula toruloides ATCC 204091]|uniref:Putative RAD57 protein n=1 Tax=Rhodotorula toruloides TaxID=5286 RepID=A0A2S9ZXX4_RHOTO|nr:putative RAD57 protein [Rhodotorula toruloides ATCC 204091]KAK4330797.1 DNA repair protein RAD57 [Rhodotorula toruloides]PRQ70618.1 putative RAD57 protein [Rhodotorula toruloides]
MQNVELKDLASLTPKYRAHLVKAGYLTAAEVLLSSPSALTQRTKLPPTEVLHLLSAISHAVCSLPSTIDKSVAEIVEEEERKGLGAVFTTGDEGVDLLLGGGIRVGSLTELAGQSSSGKTNLCLQLCVTVQLSRSRGGLGGGALFITSEGKVPSTRLFELAEHYSSVDETDENSRTAWDFLDNIHTEKAPDIETLSAVLSYHAPATIERVASASRSSSPASSAPPSTLTHPPGRSQPKPPLPIRLLVLDSIAAPFRAETETGTLGFANRAKEFAQLGDTLKRLANVYGVAVVVVNQVTDVWWEGRGGRGARVGLEVFGGENGGAGGTGYLSRTSTTGSTHTTTSTSSTSSSTGLPPPPHTQYSFPPLLYSRFQSPHFLGPSSSLSHPFLPLPFIPSGPPVSAALGHAWNNIPNTRLLCLVKRDAGGTGGGRTRRCMCVVWSPYAPRGVVEYEVRQGEGVRSVGEVRVRAVGRPPAWMRDEEDVGGGAAQEGAGEMEVAEEEEDGLWGTNGTLDGQVAWDALDQTARQAQAEATESNALEDVEVTDQVEKDDASAVS